MNNVVMKRMFRFWNRISIRILFIFVLITPFLVDSLPQREGKQRGNQDSCNVDADCQKNGQTNRCCSQFYFCGTGPDYCAEGTKYQQMHTFCHTDKKIFTTKPQAIKESNHFRVYLSRCWICWRRLVESARRRWSKKTIWWPVYNCLWKKSKVSVSIKCIDSLSLIKTNKILLWCE